MLAIEQFIVDNVVVSKYISKGQEIIGISGKKQDMITARSNNVTKLNFGSRKKDNEILRDLSIGKFNFSMLSNLPRIERTSC